MTKGLIFDIKRYAIHDGPGIRTTVFFKGCPLRCPWCHNPEGQESEPEIMVRPERCAESCQECISLCPQGAISKNGDFIVVDPFKCDFCAKCMEACVYEAIDIIGREVEVRDVVDEMEKDRIFFDESGGGISLSGGEPLMQLEFLEALLSEFKKKKIRTTVDTCGYAPFDALDRIRENVDLFLYDIKIMDDRKHKEYTGISNQIIIDNLEKLSKKGANIAIRIPIIPGINDDEENIRSITEFLISLNHIKRINLLPFHRGGIEKYKRLGKEIQANTVQPPSSEKIERIKKMLEDSGFSVKTGG
ncbi:MAG: glycyl-radical enzyme activating protein [Candidatus Aminicenantes bacterium]|nr:MAG: glycyl-radical enzyme activating protein [Candidatus Aminicenantes bacterium]